MGACLSNFDVLSNRGRVWALNSALVAMYVAFALFAPSPWAMLAAFLGFAILVRCLTFVWMFAVAREVSARQGLLAVAFNLVGGLLLAGALITGLWWLGKIWLAGVKVLVPLIAVIVAYKSTFPLLPAAITEPEL